MALPKVLGIETEYGIMHRGVADSNPVLASSMLINSYLADLDDHRASRPGVPFDFEDETRAEMHERPGELAYVPDVETHLVNAVLTNGGRYYVDHAHPEMSSPECADALSVLVFDRAADVILQRSMTAANRRLPEGQELVVHKNNSDGKGNSYGCHENYLMARSVPFAQIVAQVTPHFVTRQIYTGSGKVGSEAPGVSSRQVPYQLTQRADFFEAEVGLETTLKRPIVNTHDEPHADAQKYRRLHVITADANCSETATLLKVGTTAMLLAMIEDGELPAPVTLRDPVRALREVSYDLTVGRPLERQDGGTITAIETQRGLYDAVAWSDRHGFDAVGGESVGRVVLRTWDEVLTGLEQDPMQLADRLDWVAKYRILDGYRERHDLRWGDARLGALALQYHDLRPERSLAARAGLVRLTRDQAVEAAVTEPPEDTRAYFRGRCVQRWGAAVVTANWDSIVLDTGQDSLQRIPMMEPLRGTRAQVGTLVDQSTTTADLVARLGGHDPGDRHG